MFKRVLASVREFKRDTLLTPLFVALDVLLEVSIPTVMANLIDNGIDAGNMSVILKTGALLIGMALLALVCGSLSCVFGSRASAGFARNLRHDMYYKVQEYSFANIDKFSVGGIVTRLTTDVSDLQMAYMMGIRIAVRCPLTLVAALIMTIRTSPRMALIFLAVVPVLAVSLILIAGKAHPLFMKMFEAYDHVNNVIQENLTGIRVVKSYVREDHEKEKFKGVSGEIFDFSYRAEKLLALNQPVMQGCVYACMLMISWFGAHHVVSGTLTTGQLTSLFNYISQILMSLMMLSMIFIMLTQARASAERIAAILDEESDLANCADPATEVPDGSVDFENVSFSYAKDMDRLCLTDVDLHIASGETVGILGGTGTSKTTLVQLIPRLYDVTAGSVKVGGRDVREYDLETLRNNVAMVLQKNELFSGTIKDNLRWGDADATDEEIVHVCELAQADGFIREMPDGYDTHIEQGGTNVSGGQKQRLCIARALLKRPKILILDDSTSAVDTKTDALIRKAFREYIPETTKFIIAQRVASVEDADHIIVMEGGRIAAFGTHEELMRTSDIYREVYESQTKGGDADAAENA